MAITAIASSLAEETRSFLTTGTSRVYSNRESKKNKCDYGMPESAGRVCV